MWTAIALSALGLACLAGLRVNLRTRLDRATRSTDASVQERSEALTIQRSLSRLRTINRFELLRYQRVSSSTEVEGLNLIFRLAPPIPRSAGSEK